MSEKKFFDKEMTRRQFLKMSGKGMAGLALSSSLLSLFGVTKAEVEAGAVSVTATADAVLVANGARCTGCRRCEMNCTLLNDGKVMPFISRVKVTRNLYHGNDGKTGGIFNNFDYTPDTCKQCEKPACLEACPMSAISVNAKGVKVIDEEKCVGCGMCVSACPFDMPTIDPETRKSTKCVSCGYCVANCPCGALKIVKWEDVAAAMAK
ncbi:MAG: ferredoxin-like protein [Clostridia bacterium]|nr:ferredoxin-like protein [Clostridia bacterium]